MLVRIRAPVRVATLGMAASVMVCIVNQPVWNRFANDSCFKDQLSGCPFIYNDSIFVLQRLTYSDLQCFYTADCRDPGTPPNGYRRGNSLTYKSVVHYTCARGHVISGPSSTQCKADGTWSNPVPTCKSIILWLSQCIITTVGFIS